jgi:glycerophosphoryl diester phosphodiesterase
MIVISHRGYHDKLPENTIQAFEQALGMGVDGIETDVCVTSDGLPILFHDRLAPDGREVSALTRDELAGLVQHSVPTLDELEQLIVRSPKSTIWNLEIKQPPALAATLAMIARQRSAARFLVTSFWHPAVLEAATKTDIECGLLVCHRPPPFARLPEWLSLHPNLKTMVWDYERLDAALVADAASCGLRNLVYGVVTPEDHRRALQWGVDGVITDRPELVLSHSI